MAFVNSDYNLSVAINCTFPQFKWHISTNNSVPRVASPFLHQLQFKKLTHWNPPCFTKFIVSHSTQIQDHCKENSYSFLSHMFRPYTHVIIRLRVRRVCKSSKVHNTLYAGIIGPHNLQFLDSEFSFLKYLLLSVYFYCPLKLL